MVHLTGSPFAYANIDWPHFVRQIFFASDWGLHVAHSFNGPVWSVSIEVLLYAVFFAACRMGLNRWWHMGALAACGCLLILFANDSELGHGLLSFFIGGITYRIFAKLAGMNLGRPGLAAIGAIGVLLWLAIPLNFETYSLFNWYKGSALSGHLKFGGSDVPGIALLNLTRFSIEGILFPATILMLALWEATTGGAPRQLDVIGQLSYSSYLLHFPLQLVFAAGAVFLGISQTFFYSRLALFLFFVVLIPLSIVSHNCLERPCQALL